MRVAQYDDKATIHEILDTDGAGSYSENHPEVTAQSVNILMLYSYQTYQSTVIGRTHSNREMKTLIPNTDSEVTEYKTP